MVIVTRKRTKVKYINDETIIIRGILLKGTVTRARGG